MSPQKSTRAPEEWEARTREEGLPGPSELLEGHWLECSGANAGAGGGYSFAIDDVRKLSLFSLQTPSSCALDLSWLLGCGAAFLESGCSGFYLLSVWT